MIRAELLDLQWRKLHTGLRHVLAANPFYQRRFHAAGLALDSLTDWDDWRRVPFTTKEDLVSDQEKNPPYGTNLTLPADRYVRLHQTTGTSGRRLCWLDSAAGWSWLTDELWPAIFRAVGMSPNDRLFFPFSFGPFLGFWAAFDSAVRHGWFVLPAGGMTTVARLQLMLDHRMTFVLCTPTYALRMAEVAQAEGIDLAGSPVRGLILAGEPGANIPAVRERLQAAWGARVFDHSGMTEIGSLGIEFAELPGKLFLLEEHAIGEFVDPKTDVAVPAGEVGELVLTNLGRWDSPLLRYRTGDLVRWRDDVHPTGLPYVYLDGGILARTDDMLWIKGNNVYPSAIEQVVREFAEVAEFRLEASGIAASATLVIVVEPTTEAMNDAGLSARIARAIQNRLYFLPNVTTVAPGTLPRFEMKAHRLVRQEESPILG